MLWMSLRFGWGNTGPVILLALLPILAFVPGAADRQPSPPEISAQLPAALAEHAPLSRETDAGMTAIGRELAAR